MQAGPTASQRRIRAMLLVATSAAVAWSMLWGLSRLLETSLPAGPEPESRVEISLVDPEPEQPSDQPQLPQATPRAKPAQPRRPQLAPQRPIPKKEAPKPKEKKEEPKPKPTIPKQRLKMVEQDPDDETPPPDQPDYLSNVDRKVKEQTRAKDARLDSERPKAKPKATQKSPPKPAAKAQKERLAQRKQKPGSPLLKMRGQPKPSTAATNADDALASREHGALQNKTKSAPATPQGQHGDHHHHAPRLALGGSAAAMRAAIDPQAASQGSQRFKPPEKEGLWDKARKSYTSPLDNVVPEVRAGNQTALNSRKHPFAQYIAQMHRGIHAVWGDGVLRQWDRLGPKHAWNDFSLWTRVEIVLWPTGEIDSVKTVRRSGNSSFDGVARNSVYNAGPYPPAPEQIRSGNGKVYIHWAFHRNAYACGTFGAEPFILDNAGQGARPDPNAPIDEGAVPSETRRRVYGPAEPTR